MIKKFLSLTLVFIVILSVFYGCTESNDSKKATFYCTKESFSDIDMLVAKFNKQAEPKDMIEIVEFETEEELSNKFLTEIMAGKGPDIMGTAVLYRTKTPVEKLIKQDIFLNLDALIKNDKSEDKIDLSEYNQPVMNMGIFDGARYYIPTTWSPNVVTASAEYLQKYLSREIVSGDTLTYQNLIEIDGNMDGYIFCDSVCKDLFYDCVNCQIDVYNQTMDFDNKDFIETISKLKDFVNCNENDSYLEQDEYVFSTSGSLNLFHFCEEFVRMNKKGKTTVVLNLPSKDNASSANINDAIFVNKNSKHTDTALKFIKYALSEEVQSEWTGADISEYNPHHSDGDGIYYPVNNTVMNKLYDKASKISFDKVFAENYPASLEIATNNIKMSNEDMKQIKEYLNSIQNYEFRDMYTYYNERIINDTVEKFLNDEITLPIFIDQLKSKTSIYLNE